MPPQWLRAAVLTLAVLSVVAASVSGCGRENSTATSSATADQIVATVQPSVVVVQGPACNGATGGSGFVVGPHRVVSTADTVAGTDSVSVGVDGKSYVAQVVYFDSNGGVAMLDVPGLTAQPLSLASERATKGADALLLGYPGMAAPAAVPARIGDVITMNSRDIYNTTLVNREVYEIKGIVEPGLAGGPLIDMRGHVLGMVIGRVVERPEVGLVLTAHEISRHLEKAGSSTLAVPTGRCINR